MKDIMSIIQTENKKIWKKKSSRLMILALVVLCTALGIYNHSVSGSTNSALNNVYRSTALLPFSVIIVLILVITNLTAEYQYGTIKQLLSTSISRSKWLCSKYIAFVLVAIQVLALQFVTGFVVGLLMDGVSSPVIIENHDGIVTEINILKPLFHQYTYYLLFLLVFILIAQSLAILTRSSIVALTGSLFVWFGNSFLCSVLGAKTWYKYTFFPHISSTNYLESGMFKVPDSNMAQSLIIVGAYLLVLTIAAFVAFNKRDI